MGIFRTKYFVRPNQVGLLFRANVLEQKFQPGIYKVSDWSNETEMFPIPTASRIINVINQEVLSKDNIALRFSFLLMYRITDCEKFLCNFELNRDIQFILGEGEQRIANFAQVHLRGRISMFDSEELNEKRAELADFKSDELQKQVADLGVTIELAQLKDITFPKTIQDLFSKTLEAKIRAKADLENARTTVASARALKNASELMKNDDNIRFFQFLETMTKIAATGKHTFMIGELPQMHKGK